MWGKNKKDGRESRESMREALRLFAYLKPYRRHFFPALACLFITAALSLAFPYLMGELIGGAVNVGTDSVTSQIDRVALTLLAVLALQAFIAYWRIRWFAFAGESGLADIRKDTYSKLVRMPMNYFSEHRVGELSSRIAADLTLIRDALILTVPQIIRQSVMLVGGLIFIFVSSWKLTAVMLSCIPVVVILMSIFGRGIRSLSKDAQDEMAGSNVIVEETLQGISSVKSFSNEAFETRRYSGALGRFVDVTLGAARARALFVSFIIFVLFGAITFVVWYGSGMLGRGEIEFHEFNRFVLFSIFIGAALGSFPDILSQVHKAVGATARVREILADETEDVGLDDTLQVTRFNGGVEMKDVSFSYPSRADIDVLATVSFTVAPGERVAIVGPSGAGKSTIVQLLLRFYDPCSGEVRFDGKNAQDYSLQALRSQMAIVPQEVLLFGGSIKENIAYGWTGAEEADIEEAARKANAHGFISDFPEGYETLVGDRGVKLSGGQRQRIAIARAILADPAILLLDEATSSLDSESEQAVQEALDGLMKGRTSIIIAHRLSTIREADRILVLRDGQIVESGTHEELSIKEGGVYRMLSELQFAAD
ncbi:MAG: ATP-binding cassette domain-containing protein [Verrucomicrobiaceae bacterium]|nr:ATP-binding cassette domain-containing protein [Verrucomicrobiaceae bacterium]